MRENKLLWLMLVFVCLVSGFDTYMSIKIGHKLQYIELNPIALFLILLDNGSVALMIGIKSTLGMFASVVLAQIILSGCKFKRTIIYSISVMQFVVLLSYYPLLYSEHFPY